MKHGSFAPAITVGFLLWGLTACGQTGVSHAPSFRSSVTYAHQHLIEYRGGAALPDERKNLNVVDLFDGGRSVTALPNIAINRLAPSGGAFHRIAWSPIIKRFLFATYDAIFLISPDGDTQQVNLLMPGDLKPYWRMETYAIAVDGKFVAYYLGGRDVGDRKEDPVGRLYQDLMFQRTEGSTPKIVAQGERPTAISWSPNDDRLAFSSSDRVSVVDLAGRKLWNIQLGKGADPSGVNPSFIMDLQWQPTGQTLALISGDQIYLVKADGTDLRRISFRGTDTNNLITSIAWSPDGLQLALRMVISSTCHFALREDTLQECHSRSSLFVSDLDGGHLQRIPDTEFEGPPRPYTNLFWIY
jgi:WD40 repeat protein